MSAISTIGQTPLSIENITLNVDNITLLIGLSIDKEGIEPLRISKIENIITITRMILKNIVYQNIILKKITY